MDKLSKISFTTLILTGITAIALIITGLIVGYDRLIFVGLVGGLLVAALIALIGVLIAVLKS